MVYLQTENCGSGQKKEIEWQSALSQSSRRHFVGETGRLRSVQRDKNLEVQQPPKSEFLRGREAELVAALQQSSCFADSKNGCVLRAICVKEKDQNGQGLNEFYY